MLAHARRVGIGTSWVLGRAERLPLERDSFDLVFSVDVIHHVGRREAFYQEVTRALCAGGRVCTVADAEGIIRSRPILSAYLRETVAVELARYPRIERIRAWMPDSGLVDVRVSTVEQHQRVTGSQPFRDRAYSSLHLVSEQALHAGLERLEKDPAAGPIPSASRHACIGNRKP